MLPLRRIGGFFLCLLLVYGVLAAAWPIVGGVYAHGYRAVGNVVFGSFGSDGKVVFLPTSQDNTKMDTTIQLRNDRTRSFKTFRQNSRLVGYILTVEVMALILATPLPRSRKWKALIYGWILANSLVVFRVAVLVLYGFGGTHKAALYLPGPFWGAILDFVYRVTTTFGFEFVAPIVVWILVSFRKGDLARVFQESVS